MNRIKKKQKTRTPPSPARPSIYERLSKNQSSISLYFRDDDDNDVINFQYDSSTPLRYSAPAYYINEKLRAKDKKSPCQDCSTPSGMRQTSTPPLFFFGDAVIIALAFLCLSANTRQKIWTFQPAGAGDDSGR
jgi:hypothetical protein